MQALEVRHKSRVGKLEGEVRGLHQSQAAKQATLATRLKESRLREQVCNTSSATPPVSATCPHVPLCAAGMQSLPSPL